MTADAGGVRNPRTGEPLIGPRGLNCGMIIRPHIDRWIAWQIAAGRPGTTIRLRTYHVERVLLELDVDPWKVTTEELVEYLALQSWGPETRRSYRASLRGFFRWAHATGRRPDDPAALIPPIALPRALPRPTPEAIYRQALLDADDRVRLMIQLAAQCGLRAGEIASLRQDMLVTDVLGQDSLHITGKGQHQRMVPVHPDLARELRALPPGWAFPCTAPGRGRRTGRHLTSNHVGRLVSAELPDGWTCHTLRHRCMTVAYWSTNDLRAVQEFAGHAKPETTARYTLVKPDAVRAAMMAAAA